MILEREREAADARFGEGRGVVRGPREERAVGAKATIGRRLSDVSPSVFNYGAGP